MIRRILVLLFLSASAAAAPSLLQQAAPTAAEVQTQHAAAEGAVRRAEAIGDAALLLQNALAPRRAEQQRLPVCKDPAVTSLVARLRLFGPAWRDAAQQARVEVARAADMATRAGGAGGGTEGLVARSAQQASRAAEADVWHRQYVESSFAECGPEVTAAPGIPRPGAVARGEVAPGIAVVGLGGGSLCPDYVPADGRVVVLSGREACVSRSACACTPEPVAPGAVLTAAEPDPERPAR